MLENYQFSNCRIIGPAVLVLLHHVEMLHCSWDAPGLEAVFWEIPQGRDYVVGAVGIASCTFSNCRFEQIGIAGSPELREQIAQAFSGS